jgi:hypothetical protein
VFSRPLAHLRHKLAASIARFIAVRHRAGAPFWKSVIVLTIAALLFALAGTAYGALVFYRGDGDKDKNVHVSLDLRGKENQRDPDLVNLRDAKVEDFAMNDFEFVCTGPNGPPFKYRDSGNYKGSIPVQDDGDFTGSSELYGKPNVNVEVKGQFSHREAKVYGWFKVHYRLPNSTCTTDQVDWTAHAK